MKDLNFDIYAMLKPKGASDVLALLKEFNAEAEDLLANLEALDRACEVAKAAEAA